ncbi:hypothetical protein Tco_0989637 [Tanacetum coccineum]|uniref:Uncharacterized protein n=1 Tax=Tanacetum coccineum TaxID=301880 RepID=A0ABQ5EU79_9ASTR
MEIPPRDQRHRYLRSEGLGYTGADITDFEERLGRIYGKEIHRVQVFNFGGLTYLMAEGLSGRMLIEHRDAKGHSVLLVELGGGYLRFKAWLHTAEEMESAGFGAYWAKSARQIPNKGGLSAYWVMISSAGDFLGTSPSYTSITDLMLRLCHMLIACNIAGRSQAPKKVTVTDLFYLRGVDVGSVNIPYLLARYLGMFASGRKRGVMISEGQFVARLAEHVAAAGALEVAEGAPDVDESDHAVSVPVHAPQPPTSGHYMACDFSQLTTWTVTGLSRMMDQAGVRIKPGNDLTGKEIDEVGEVSIIWNLMLIIEYLVKISKKARILELKQRHLKILTLISYTPYPSRKIRRIFTYTSQKTMKE